MKAHFKFEQIVLQPTTLCNLDCKYCYLPERNKNQRMHQDVAKNIATSIQNTDYQVRVTWHGGEPLACGLKHFSSLIAPFSHLEATGQVVHVIQTNATLIDQAWAELFSTRQFRVGISIDGPTQLNSKRVDWHGRDSFQKILRGIEFLRKLRIEFSAIAVIGAESLDKASEIYDFFCNLGCSSLGINFEEKVGIHNGMVSKDSAVLKFWSDLFQVWKANPVIEVRELRHVLSWMNGVCAGKILRQPSVEIFPCVAFNGDIVLLSPEFLGAKSEVYSDFVVGNVLESDLSEILERGATASYVVDYLAGINRCLKECPYFSSCGGVSASNKFYETGSTNATETIFCRNSAQSPVDALLKLV